MNEFEKTNQQDASKGNKRRSFLKKSATGAVVFSLPAKSVWGACTTSGMTSGNMSHRTEDHVCIMPINDNGANADLWKDAKRVDNKTENTSFPLLFNEVKLAKANDGISDAEYSDIVGLYADELDAALLHDLNLPIEITSTSYTVSQALQSTDLNLQRLGAIYLNAYFGIYAGYNVPHAAQASELVVLVYLFMIQNDRSEFPMNLMDNDFLLASSDFALSTLDLTP